MNVLIAVRGMFSGKSGLAGSGQHACGPAGHGGTRSRNVNAAPMRPVKKKISETRKIHMPSLRRLIPTNGRSSKVPFRTNETPFASYACSSIVHRAAGLRKNGPPITSSVPRDRRQKDMYEREIGRPVPRPSLSDYAGLLKLRIAALLLLVAASGYLVT